MHRYGFTDVYELPRIRAKRHNSADRAPRGRRSLLATGSLGVVQRKRTVSLSTATCGLAAAALAALLACPAQAQTPPEFYRGKTIELDISSSVGGGYDGQGRLLARPHVVAWRHPI
jgi:hypothetical protein